MRDLDRLQKIFQNYLLNRDPLIQKDVLETAKVSARTRLDIYYEAYFLRLLEALQADYPVLYFILGNEDFKQLAYAYSTAHPSRFRSLRFFGKNFSAFLQEHKPYSNQPWYAELAAFEWAMIEAFDAADEQPVSVDDMGIVPCEKWATLCFKLHPSLSQLNLNWNIVEIWENVKKYARPSDAIQEKHEDSSWIIWRKEFATQFCALSADKAYMLGAMEQGDNFAVICGRLCDWCDETNVAVHAAGLLKGFILDGLITQIITN